MNILLVDDHKLFREGMRYVLEAGLQENGKASESLVIYEVANCKSAMACAAQLPQLDIVLMDLNLPDSQGIEGIELFINTFPVLPLVVISASLQRSIITRSLDAGAMGYIPKDSPSTAVINAIRLVLTGNIYDPPVLLGLDRDKSPADNLTLVNLTRRQQEVMQLIAEGNSNKEIARKLDLAEATVKMHVTHLMRALKVSNRTQAVVAAEKCGLVKIE